MSRVGKKPILIPEGVKAEIANRQIIITGLKGELRFTFPKRIIAEIKDNQISFSLANIEGEKLTSVQAKKTRSLWGLARSRVASMVEGVVKGFEKKLEINGLGYRAQLEGEDLSVSIGFSHPVRVKKIEGIKFAVEKNLISVSGIDKELVGRVAANIRQIKIPDPYKAKGIKYEGEVIRKKAGKKATTITK